jgi:hypothetical protein
MKAILLFIGISISNFCIGQTIDWAKKFELGVNAEAEGTSIFIDNKNNAVYIAGNFSFDVDFDPGPGTFSMTTIGWKDGFLVKLDTSGNFIWARQFGGPIDDYLNGLTINSNGNILITGEYHSIMDCDPGPSIYNITTSSAAMFVISLDSSGTFLWAKSFTGLNQSGYGYKLVCDTNSNIYVTGNPGLLKLDSLGTAIDSFSVYNCWGYGILFDKSGYIYFCGYILNTVDFDPGIGVFNLNDSINNEVGFIAKYDLNFNLIWAKEIESTTGGSRIYQLAQSDNKDIFASGVFTNDCDFDPGPLQNILNASSGLRNGFILKLNINGDFIVANSIGGNKWDEVSAIALSKNGKIYIAGYFADSVDFDFGTNQNYLYSYERAGFIGIYDTLLNFGQVSLLKSNTQCAQIYSLAIDQENFLYGTGNFRGNIDFDINAGTYYLNTDTFYKNTPIFKYEDLIASGGNQNKSSNGFNIYPNPSSGRFMIRLLDPSLKIRHIQVMDINGICAKYINVGRVQNENISLEKLPKGEYYITVITNENKEFTQKIITN